jgi:hypothetical protein
VLKNVVEVMLVKWKKKERGITLSAAAVAATSFMFYSLIVSVL